MRSPTTVHTVASLADLSAGPAYSVPGLAKAQARLGSEVELHSLGGIPMHDVPGLQDRRHKKDFGNWPLLGRLGVSNGMKRVVSNAHHEIVHSHGLWMMPNTYRSRRGKFVIAPRGMLTPVALSFSPLKKRMFRALFQDRALTAVDLFHATAQSEYDDIRRFGLTQPVAIIPNGIDLPESSPDWTKAARRTVLSLGRIHPKKALDSLLRAWATIEPDFPTWSLRIVGPDEGGHAAELRCLINRLRLKRARIDQPVFGAEKIALMASAGIFVLPSRSENFAMTVAESLSVNVPVVATKGTPWAELELHRCGWWIDHGPDALSMALRTALALPDAERRAMGERGHTWMKRDFSWEQMGRMSLEAYAWVLGRGPKPDFVQTR